MPGGCRRQTQVETGDRVLPRCSIAYLVLAHEDPGQLGLLLKRLQSETVRFHVHVDAKTDIAPFRRAAADVDQVFFCETRVKVTWAAFSVVRATLQLIEAALNHDDLARPRLVLLSGADYPLVANDEIARFFEQHPRHQFIRRFPIQAADETQISKVRGRHFRELAPRGSWLRPPLFALERVLRLFPRNLPHQLPLMCGSQWWALTADCARYCLEFARTRPDLLKFFQSVFSPDEIYFHTVVHNSRFAVEADRPEPFDEVVTKSGGLSHYANFHYLPGRLIVSAEDARAALSARPTKLFARKFSSVHSRPALRAINEQLDCAGAAEAGTMGRWP